MNIQKVTIVYFTGTGGTEKAAEAFEKDFFNRKILAKKHEIKKGRLIDNGDEDLLVLLFAVHAANAPLPVYQWLEGLKSVDKKPAVVVSVSAGGEVTPNTACRVSSIRRLEKKGYAVIYEHSIVMPSNFIVSTPDPVAVKLLEVLPQKVEKINDEILSGTFRRIKPKFIDSILSVLFELEKKGTKTFGKRLFTDDKCTGCGWCAEKCPAQNIRMQEGQPVFGRKCVMCFGCIYGCPENAIQAKSLRFTLIKTGFSIGAIEKKALQKTGGKDDFPKGILWKGIRKYLEADERRN